MGELDPLTPFATVQLKQGLEELLQRPVDLVRLGRVPLRGVKLEARIP